MANPVFACLHTKQITVRTFTGEKGEGEIYGSKCEQISGTACFTAVVGSEREGRSLTANLSVYFSIQGSDARYEEIETYADRWDMENIWSESELSTSEILIEEVKLNGNLVMLYWVFLDRVS